MPENDPRTIEERLRAQNRLRTLIEIILDTVSDDGQSLYAAIVRPQYAEALGDDAGHETLAS